MSKKKQLIHDVFERIKETSEKDTKNGWADDLSDAIEKKTKFKISGKTLSRYYESYIEEVRKETTIENLILNKLSEYLDYNDYADYCSTIEKKGENASKTTVKIDVDNQEVSSMNGLPNVNVTITNTNSNDNKNDQHFKVPDFIKQNGLGILEMTFVLLLVTGGVFFSKGKAEKSTLFPLTFMSGIDSAVEKSYMYWDGERYIATDSSYISPEFDVVAINEHQLKFLRRITRKDTMTVENSIGRTWYSKCYGEVEFFTADGIDPDTKTELRKSSSYIIDKYAGKNAEPLLVEE